MGKLLLLIPLIFALAACSKDQAAQLSANNFATEDEINNDVEDIVAEGDGANDDLADEIKKAIDDAAIDPNIVAVNPVDPVKPEICPVPPVISDSTTDLLYCPLPTPIPVPCPLPLETRDVDGVALVYCPGPDPRPIPCPLAVGAPNRVGELTTADLLVACPIPQPCDRPQKQLNADGSFLIYCPGPTPRPVPCPLPYERLTATDRPDFSVCPMPEPDPNDHCRIRRLSHDRPNISNDVAVDLIRKCRDDIDRIPPDVKTRFFAKLKKRLLYLSDKLDNFFKRFKNLPERLQEKLKDRVIHKLKYLHEVLEFVQQRLNENNAQQAEIIRIIEEIQSKIIRFVESL